MKKVLKDTKSLLLENMAKLNPDFQLTKEAYGVPDPLGTNKAKPVNEEDKWIQKAVDPEHKGYCTPMSKPTCTPKRKALARRFKRGIDETAHIEDFDEDSPEYINRYKERVDKIKSFMDDLLNQGEFEVLDTLYRLLIDRSSKPVTVGQPALTEDHSPEYQQKAEQLKGKIDFLYDNNHYDMLDKVDSLISKMFPDDGMDEVMDLPEPRKSVQNDTYFETLSEALDAVRERVGKKGYAVDEDDMFTQFGTGGINYGQTKRATISLLRNGVPDKRRSVTIAIYRMDSGKYELTAYLN